MLVKIMEFVRIAGVGLAFYLGYATGFAEPVYNPAAQLHIMIPVCILFIAGFSSLEGIFFGRMSAEAKGYEQGSNYQLQSAFALLAITLTSMLVWHLDWGIRADLTIFFVFIMFFILSGANHGWQAVKHHNYKFANINRPFLVLLLLSGFVYPIFKVLQQL